MTTAPATILVVTVVHHPEDARIRYREIIALLDDGWQVTYAAPFTGYNMAVPSAGDDGNGFLRFIDLPRARGRRRLGAMSEARRLVQRSAGRYDLVLLHDPELLLSVLGTRARNVVWDVHEDTAAAVIAKPWIPRLLKRVVAAAVHRVERWAERRMPLLLAEYVYQERFDADSACAESGRIARRHQARIVGCEVGAGGEVSVTISVQIDHRLTGVGPDRAEGRARAGPDPAPDPDP